MIGNGEIIKIYKKLKPKSKMCVGCRNDFYNGNNSLGVRRCLYLGSAKVCDKKHYVSIHSNCKTINKKTLSCWTGNR